MLYEVTDVGLRRQEVGRFADLGMYERAGLQRLLRQDPRALGEDCSSSRRSLATGRTPVAGSTYSRSTGTGTSSSSN
jgi:hypothetical protein